MNEPLTPGEKIFLRDLKAKRIWQDILSKIEARTGNVPGYRPNDDAIDKQVADWKYRSGIDRGIKDVLKLLTDE